MPWLKSGATHLNIDLGYLDNGTSVIKSVLSAESSN